jgi:hypothetical protein
MKWRDGMRRALPWLAALGFAACTDKIAAPGDCPAYCPTGTITVVDTVLPMAVYGDSAFGRPVGYVNPFNSLTLLADALPGLRDSRPIFRTTQLLLRLPLSADTTTSQVNGVDSIRLRLTILRRDSAAHNLTISLYKLPLSIDSNTTFGQLVGPFTDSLIRRVNVDSVIALPGRRNAAGDSVLVDTTNQRIILLMAVDSAHLPIDTPDSGAVALGIRVAADTLASIAIGSSENVGTGPLISWYLRVDSLGIATAHRLQTRSPAFDGFVYDPPSPALDSNLTVGGVPSARSVLRVVFPQIISDSSRLIRATLELVPAVAPQGITADSFGIAAHAAVTDFGAKSPIDLMHVDTTGVQIGTTDTVKVEVTRLMRYWIGDSLAPHTMVLRQTGEGGNFAEIRFYSSRDPAHRPLLRLTYSNPFPFGKP